ncbi:MAG: arylsulfatase [Planctomycetota bacterium]|nr:arylsulfatase [Planctomycetota bacterium]MDA1166250.1 arylsulfatase [Planctomycetota bacterium]
MKHALLLLTLWVTCGPSDFTEAARPPNIVFIVADDLGYSDLGCFGGEIKTPHLDSLADNGLRLTRFYNMGRCCPSRTSILTGHYPHRVGVGHKVADLGQPGYRGAVSPDAPTIAESLKSVGYRSFISGKWHLGTPDPTRHGFEEFYGTLVSAQTFWDPGHYLRLPEGRLARNYDPSKFYGTDAVTDHALDFLQEARQTPDKPWFMYLAYHAPHFPLHARRSDIEKYADTYHVGWDQMRNERLTRMKRLGIVPEHTQLTPRSRYWDYGEKTTGANPAWNSLPEDRRIDLARRMAIYAAMIDRIDHNVGRVLNDLRSSQELDNSLVVFLSDNGACAEWDPYGFDVSSSPHNILHRDNQLDQMGGPDTYSSVGSGWANASNTPWRLYKHYTHEGGIASPCIIHWPANSNRRGEIDHRPTHIIDLMPTVNEIAEAQYPGSITLPGRSFVPMLKDEPAKPRTLYFEHESNKAILEGQWKLVALKEHDWELYNVNVDRTELEDLAVKHPAIVKRLAAQWDRWAKDNFVTPLPRDYGVKYLKPLD